MSRPSSGELDRASRLAEASYALHTTLDLTELLDLILDAAKGGRATRIVAPCSSCRRTERSSGRASCPGTGISRSDCPWGRALPGSVAETGESVRIRDARSDARFDDSWDAEVGLRDQTAPDRADPGSRRPHGRGVPAAEQAGRGLRRRGRGLPVRAQRARGPGVENAWLHRSAIEKERQDREIRLVQTVQRAYQPERLERQVGCLSSAGLNQLCEDASGDYYDIIELDRRAHRRRDR